MPDYTKGKIYKVLNTLDDEVYIGSTFQPLSNRMTGHRKSCFYSKHMTDRHKLYKHMRDIGKDKFYIELIKDFPCETKWQLFAEEGIHIREIGTLNEKIAGRSGKQYKEDHKERYKSYAKEYHLQNQDKIRERAHNHYWANREHCKAYRIETVTCECGVVLSRTNKSIHLKSQQHKKAMEAQTPTSAIT